MRPALLLALLLALLASVSSSCAVFGGLSQEDELRLKEYRKRAGRYYDEANRSNNATYFTRALDQTDKGLALVPRDYKLKQRRAWCLLMLAQRDQRYLEATERAFEEVMAMRSDDDHDPRTLLGYALTLHKRGYHELVRAGMLEDEAKRQGSTSTDSNAPLVQAKERRKVASAYFRNSERQLHKLLAKEDFERVAYRHLMNLKILDSDRAAAKKHGEDFLKVCKREQRYWEARYQATMEQGFEQKVVLPALAELDEAELWAHDQLASLHVEDREYEKAIAHLDEMLKKRPNQPVQYYNRGSCYRHLDRPAEAKRDFKKFLGTHSLSPTDTKVKDAFGYTYRK